MIRSKLGVRSLPIAAEQQCMRLAAMVGLVVEEMVERRRSRCSNSTGVDDPVR